MHPVVRIRQRSGNDSDELTRCIFRIGYCISDVASQIRMWSTSRRDENRFGIRTCHGPDSFNEHVAIGPTNDVIDSAPNGNFLTAMTVSTQPMTTVSQSCWSTV